MPSILITNGTILDPSQNLEQGADLLIRDGKVADIGSNLGTADRVIDAAGCFVTPGLIDIHVHFRELVQCSADRRDYQGPRRKRTGRDRIDAGARGDRVQR